jgi:hypothetical protein
VKNVEINIGTTATTFDAGLASLAVLQRQHQQLGMGNEDVVKGFHWSSGCSGLVAPAA